MSEIDSTQYDEMSDAHANYLKGIVLHDIEIRRLALAKMLEKFGADQMVEAFAQFIGLANSVVKNSHEFLEICAIVHGGMGPYQAEKINFPTIFGALMGVKLTKHGCDQACHGCAFRRGSCANQSQATTSDAEYCGEVYEEPFMCHEDLDDHGQPTKVCQGWVRLRQSRKLSEAA